MRYVRLADRSVGPEGRTVLRSICHRRRRWRQDLRAVGTVTGEHGEACEQGYCPSAYADAVTVRSFRCRSETLLSLGDDDDPLRTIIRLNALQLFDGKRAKPVWVMANKSWCQPNGSRSIKLCKVRVRLGSGSHPAHQRIHHAPNEHMESKCKDYTVNASVSGKPFGVGVDVGVGAPVRRCETWDPRWRSPKGDVAVTWTGKVKGTRAVVILSMVSFTGVGNPGRFDGLIAHKVGR